MKRWSSITPIVPLNGYALKRLIVCLLDIGVPGMDGNELARQIRSVKAQQPLLLAVTGYGHDNNRKSALESVFDHYLVEPVDIKKIVALLVEHSETLAEIMGR